MHLDDVTDQRTLGRYVATLLPTAKRYSQSLEAYLCALLDGVVRAQGAQPSYRLFADLLERALDSEPPAPTTAALDERASGIDPTVGYERVIRQLAAQIVDLRQMREAGILGLPSIDLYCGQDSPRGHRWYNFTVWDYLEPTARHWDDSDVDPDGPDAEEVSWIDFSFILGDGQACE